MGIFEKLFGKKETLPALDPASEAAERLRSLRGQLETLAETIHDYIEMVPADDSVFVYIGKPPGTFGMVWFENGLKVNFKTLARNKGLSQRKIQTLAARLGEAYEKYADSKRFVTTIARRDVIVTPSDSFAADIRTIIHEQSF